MKSGNLFILKKIYPGEIELLGQITIVINKNVLNIEYNEWFLRSN